MQQWKVKTSTGYRRTFSHLQGAKRDYGQWCKLMNNEDEEDTPNWVKMYYRDDIGEKWRCMEEFSLEDIDEDEEEEEDE